MLTVKRLVVNLASIFYLIFIIDNAYINFVIKRKLKRCVMSEKIRLMFDDISGKYDLLNDILSFGTHRLWKKQVAAKAKAAANGSDGYYIDCATGTGDIAEAILLADPNGSAIALDFSPKMIEYAQERHDGKSIEFSVQDIMNIPYPDSTFDAATISFGIRNVDDPARVISEMGRVVKTGGSVIVLETGQPEGITGAIYRGIYKTVLPVVGGLIARNKSAYRYLPESAAAFPYGDAFKNIMKSTDRFSELFYDKKSFGVAYLYTGIVK